ncbi:xanthine dehydrogenase accessory protein XdhC [Ottowia sp. VDI28]|uniref:xanthine dehydrogenase accessory protein XdhC n=1 Tax=Ottowia sp. VDI28 TaxID=3133968 RepID=UPI003C2F0DE9
MDLEDLLSRLAYQRGVLVTVHAVQGSGPREVGAWMGVFPGIVMGSVGGGHLEWQAIAEAREMLALGESAPERVRRYPLGPSLGQCCGGVVHLRFELIDAASRQALGVKLARESVPIALFGGGHVGKALIRLLGDLPFDISWIDSRDEIFPAELPDNVRCDHSDPVEAAVGDLAPGSGVLIMSFSHAEDLNIVAACLARQRIHGDLPYIGLIGSKTKWAVFQHRLAERGFTADELSGVVCPIGLPGIEGKAPAVVAVAIAAQLLQVFSRHPVPPA